MKKLLFTTATIVCYITSLFAQPCLPEGISFTTQAQIDSFEINYPNCTEIEGSVLIDGDDITSLEPLSVLTAIGGGLIIGDVVYPYDGNPLLTSLAGLDNLASIGGLLRIWDNPVLTNLTGLNNLSSVWGLYLYNNNLLINLDGMQGLTTVEGYISIASNDALTSLTGLENLTTIGGSLSIGHSDALTDLSGLDNLTSIGEHLIINFNDVLISLTGLGNLTSINENLTIKDNNVLPNLTGLDYIEAGSIINIYISNNYALSACHVQSICDYLASPNGIIMIENNAPGCNNQEEVSEACDSVHTSIGEFSDRNIFTISPNPVGSSALIKCTLQQPSTVTISIIDVSRRRIVTLAEEIKQQGEQSIVFDGSRLAPGVYFCIIKTNQGIQTTKLVKL